MNLLTIMGGDVSTSSTHHVLVPPHADVMQPTVSVANGVSHQECVSQFPKVTRGGVVDRGENSTSKVELRPLRPFQPEAVII